jgi:predicted MFS family arabinose efflux permease
VAGVAALLGGVIVAYFSFKMLFVTMGLIDMFAAFLAVTEKPARAPLV